MTKEARRKLHPPLNWFPINRKAATSSWDNTHLQGFGAVGQQPLDVTGSCWNQFPRIIGLHFEMLSVIKIYLRQSQEKGPSQTSLNTWILDLKSSYTDVWTYLTHFPSSDRCGATEVKNVTLHKWPSSIFYQLHWPKHSKKKEKKRPYVTVPLEYASARVIKKNTNAKQPII